MTYELKRMEKLAKRNPDQAEDVAGVLLSIGDVIWPLLDKKERLELKKRKVER